METAVAFILLSLFGQQADDVMDVAAFAAYGIYIAGIQQISSRLRFRWRRGQVCLSLVSPHPA